MAASMSCAAKGNAMHRPKREEAAMLFSMHTPALIVTQSADIWKVTRDGQTIAVIERAWDDCNWLLFLADAEGHLVCQNAYRRVAALKACLRLMARRNGGRLAQRSSLAR